MKDICLDLKNNSIKVRVKLYRELEHFADSYSVFAHIVNIFLIVDTCSFLIPFFHILIFDCSFTHVFVKRHKCRNGVRNKVIIIILLIVIIFVIFGECFGKAQENLVIKGLKCI